MGRAMRVLEFEVENYRSFKSKQTLKLSSGLNIIIGPNGGGKTNLFDGLAIFLRQALIAKSTIGPRGVQNGIPRREVTANDQLRTLQLERHNDGAELPQTFRMLLEVTATDVQGMMRIYDTIDEMSQYASDIAGWGYKFAKTWTPDIMPQAGYRVEIRLENGSLLHDGSDAPSVAYIAFLRNFENDALLRGERGEHSLAFPLIYLPSHRSREGVSDSIQLSAGQSLHDQKKNTEAVYSKSPNITYQYLAMQKLVTMYRDTVDCEGGDRQKFDASPEVRQLTKGLAALGYTWDVEVRDRYANQYEIILRRDGKRVRIDQLSTGEASMLSFVEIVYGLGVTGALILIDEPELHLHPSWQEKVRDILRYLADDTGNQIIAATHSPGFVSEDTITNVNRVYLRGQESSIQELNSVELPGRSKLFRMVNLQNNAKLFFAKNVLLVEGPSDELVVRRLMRQLAISPDELEVVSVGGKSMFASYQSLLTALNVPHAIMADRDYLNEIGDDGIKAMFKVDGKAVRDKVLSDPMSRDGDRIVELISNALESGDFQDARETWDYILSRRLELKPDLNEADKIALAGEIDRLARQKVFVLTEGEIENYLPEGIGKDMTNLVNSLSGDDFCDLMEPARREELEGIIKRAIA